MHYWPAKESVIQWQIVLFTAVTTSSVSNILKKQLYKCETPEVPQM